MNVKKLIIKHFVTCFNTNNYFKQKVQHLKAEYINNYLEIWTKPESSAAILNMQIMDTCTTLELYNRPSIVLWG